MLMAEWGMSTEWCKTEHSDDFNKLRILLYCCWPIFEVVGWGDIVSFFSSILGMWSATSASHQLAQGWVHTSRTGSSALLSVGRNRPKIHNMYPSYRSSNTWLSCCCLTWEQAVYGVFYTYKWLQFPVTNIISAVCTCTEEMAEVHRGGKGMREYLAAVWDVVMSIANHGQLQLEEHCTSVDCEHRNVYTQSERVCWKVGILWHVFVPFFLQQDMVACNKVFVDCWWRDWGQLH